MFTELFAFDDDNIIQLRKVTLWKNLFSFRSEKKNPTISDRIACPSFTDNRRLTSLKRNLPPPPVYLQANWGLEIFSEKNFIPHFLTFPFPEISQVLIIPCIVSVAFVL